jgi:hypothetical protein
MKNQLAVYRRPRGGRPIIAAVSPSPEGKADDKKVYGEARMTTPSNIKRGGDTGSHGAAYASWRRKPHGALAYAPARRAPVAVRTWQVDPIVRSLPQWLAWP